MKNVSFRKREMIIMIKVILFHASNNFTNWIFLTEEILNSLFRLQFSKYYFAVKSNNFQLKSRQLSSN